MEKRLNIQESIKQLTVPLKTHTLCPNQAVTAYCQGDLKDEITLAEIAKEAEVIYQITGYLQDKQTLLKLAEIASAISGQSKEASIFSTGYASS